LILDARYLTAFTGAGISVESGIPPFRGPGGLWSRYDPQTLELSYFHRHPKEAWPVIREIFYDHFQQAQPNEAHRVLARLEERGLLKVLITQNIDNLHYLAGSKKIVEFHGNSRQLLCTSCGKVVPADPKLLTDLPPRCGCGGLLKPDFIFFGENIPAKALQESSQAVRRTDVMLVVGSTGEVYPAAGLPQEAAHHGAQIIEINPSPSNFTSTITRVFIQMKAAEALPLIEEALEAIQP